MTRRHKGINFGLWSEEKQRAWMVQALRFYPIQYMKGHPQLNPYFTMERAKLEANRNLNYIVNGYDSAGQLIDFIIAVFRGYIVAVNLEALVACFVVAGGGCDALGPVGLLLGMGQFPALIVIGI